MKRFLAALVAAVVLWTSVASAVINYGDSRVTRLFRAEEQGNVFTCTAFYVQPPIGETAYTWIVTAGHCIITAKSDRVPSDRAVTSTLWSVVRWTAAIYTRELVQDKDLDLAVGVVIDARKERERFWLANKAPERGTVFIHGFPAGVEKQTAGFLMDEDMARIRGISRSGSRVVVVPQGIIEGGSSGSPILDPYGNVVGVLWGVLKNGIVDPTEGKSYDVVYIIPVERLHELTKFLGQKDE